MKKSLPILALAMVAAASQAVVVDGSITLGEGYTSFVYQNTQTNFGDNFNELDGLFAYFTGSILNIGVTGNLASGNAIVLYFDFGGIGGGQNVLNVTGGGVPGYVSGQNGMKFDAGFNVDTIVSLNRFNNDVYYDLIDVNANSGTYQGTHPISGGGTIGIGPAFFDNSNTAGVGGGTGLDNGSSASKGLELQFSNGVVNSNVKVMAMLTNNSNGFASNQVLGGIGGGNNLAWGPSGGSGSSKIDFSTIQGDQCLLVNAVPEPGTMIALGAGLVAFARRRRK